MRTTSQEGLELIMRYEGFVSKPYLCPANYWTVGYGHLILPHEMGKWDNGISKAEAERLLVKDVGIAERAVLRFINVPLTDGQFAALVSFTFNLGGGALQRSTMRRKLNRGEYMAAANELRKWVWAGGRRLRGLVLRRAAEKELFLS